MTFPKKDETLQRIEIKQINFHTDNLKNIFF